MMKNFAVYINPSNADNCSIHSLLESLTREYGIHFHRAEDLPLASPAALPVSGKVNHRSPKIDCVLVFGGDGTILRAKDIALQTDAPILGINLGYLGFLSETTLEELKSSIRNLLGGKYRILDRMLLSCQIRRDGAIIYKGLALNDAVAYKAETPRLIHVRIFSGGRYVVDTRCDGVIASTPTGSTAYSLSAGGPILSPEMKAIVLSPLNPHLLAIRPMVFSASDHIMMRVHGLDVSATLQLDGVNCCALEENDEVLITAARKRVRFIKLSNRTFYQILRRKLHLGK